MANRPPIENPFFVVPLPGADGDFEPFGITEEGSTLVPPLGNPFLFGAATGSGNNSGKDSDQPRDATGGEETGSDQDAVKGIDQIYGGSDQPPDDDKKNGGGIGNSWGSGSDGGPIGTGGHSGSGGTTGGGGKSTDGDVGRGGDFGGRHKDQTDNSSDSDSDAIFGIGNDPAPSDGIDSVDADGASGKGNDPDFEDSHDAWSTPTDNNNDETVNADQFGGDWLVPPAADHDEDGPYNADGKHGDPLVKRKGIGSGDMEPCDLASADELMTLSTLEAVYNGIVYVRDSPLGDFYAGYKYGKAIVDLLEAIPETFSGPLDILNIIQWVQDLLELAQDSPVKEKEKFDAQVNTYLGYIQEGIDNMKRGIGKYIQIALFSGQCISCACANIWVSLGGSVDQSQLCEDCTGRINSTLHQILPATLISVPAHIPILPSYSTIPIANPNLSGHETTGH